VIVSYDYEVESWRILAGHGIKVFEECGIYHTPIIHTLCYAVPIYYSRVCFDTLWPVVFFTNGIIHVCLYASVPDDIGAI